MKRLTLFLMSIVFFLSASIIVVDAKGHGGGIHKHKRNNFTQPFNMAKQGNAKVVAIASDYCQDFKIGNLSWLGYYDKYHSSCKGQSRSLTVTRDGFVRLGGDRIGRWK